MAAPHSIEPAELLKQHLQGASPDLLGQMLASPANTMMSARRKAFRRRGSAVGGQATR